MIYTTSNAYYFAYLNRIGGIESHLYYIGRKYGHLDIIVFYRNADRTQLDRLKKYIRCIQLGKNDKIVCKKLFCCFNRDVLDQTIAEERYLVLHGDYRDMLERGQISRSNLPLDDRIDHYIGISQHVCDAWEELTGIKAQNVYEPVILDKVDKPLMLVSATRLTKEKGWERMVRLAQILDENDVNYMWFIYSNKDVNPTKNMVICEPRLDITDKLGCFDAFVQLSDNEGFCLSVVEALLRKVPIIGTDLPVFREIGLDDSNSILLKHDMSDVPVDRIRNIHKLKVNYSAPNERWGDVLVREKRRNEKIRVKAMPDYRKKGIFDTFLGRIPDPGDEFIVDRDRFYEIKAYEEKNNIHLIEKL